MDSNHQFAFNNVEALFWPKARSMLYHGCQLKSASKINNINEGNENNFIIGQIIKLVHHNKNNDNDKNSSYNFYSRNLSCNCQHNNVPTFDCLIYLSDEANAPQIFVMIFQYDQARTFFMNYKTIF